jgi:hypothetical protein
MIGSLLEEGVEGKLGDKIHGGIQEAVKIGGQTDGRVCKNEGRVQTLEEDKEHDEKNLGGTLQRPW